MTEHFDTSSEIERTCDATELVADASFGLSTTQARLIKRIWNMSLRDALMRWVVRERPSCRELECEVNRLIQEQHERAMRGAENVLVARDFQPSSRSRAGTVYRLFDAGGTLLYIGSTGRGLSRVLEHVDRQPWWPKVARAEFEQVGDLQGALHAERLAIATEHPLFNRVHQGDS